jgi:hypothetical protein
LNRILDYLHADEERHWMEAGRPKIGHVFYDIIRVVEWLDSTADIKNHALDTLH